MAEEAGARFKPGENISVIAKKILHAGRFVKIVGATTRGSYEAEEATENFANPFGVTQRESADPEKQEATSVELLVECVRRNAVAWVLAEGEVKVGDEVQVGKEGKAKKLAEKGIAVGRALGTGKDVFVEVEIF
jgi:hypothetical protein